MVCLETKKLQMCSKNILKKYPSQIIKLNTKFQSQYQTYGENHNEICDCDKFAVNTNTILDACFSLKTGKCADADMICAEHVLNAPPGFYKRIGICLILC
jgi:hypothetical protein